jgi:predicted GNAT superfamily acetyltransferase
MPPIAYRDLTTLEDFAVVVELEREIWGPGYDEVVPVPILAVTVMRGGILIGAFDPSRASGSSRAASRGDGDSSTASGSRMVGFVYSLPGIKHGRPMQWSHMAGVLEAYRSDGVGFQLKVLQRERALAMALGLIEWTYDPMQAMNAHLNFAKLAVIAEEYEINVYGESTSPLHKGNPTDRFVAEWRIGDERVQQRLHGAGPLAPVLTVEPAIRGRLASGSSRRRSSRWGTARQRHDSNEVQPDAVGTQDLAMEWRMATRGIFTAYFARGYGGGVLSRSRSAQGYVSVGEADVKATSSAQPPVPSSQSPARSSYSLRSAIIGSTRIARRAGTMPAATASPMVAATTAVSVAGSAARVSNSRPAINRPPASVPPTPISTPIPVSVMARRSTSPNTDARLAPSARRRPISGMRWLTAYQIEP